MFATADIELNPGDLSLVTLIPPGVCYAKLLLPP